MPSNIFSKFVKSNNNTPTRSDSTSVTSAYSRRPSISASNDTSNSNATSSPAPTVTFTSHSLDLGSEPSSDYINYSANDQQSPAERRRAISASEPGASGRPSRSNDFESPHVRGLTDDSKSVNGASVKTNSSDSTVDRNLKDTDSQNSSPNLSATYTGEIKPLTPRSTRPSSSQMESIVESPPLENTSSLPSSTSINESVNGTINSNGNASSNSIIGNLQLSSSPPSSATLQPSTPDGGSSSLHSSVTRSNSTKKPWGHSSVGSKHRKNTGLASAIAASGLAMANPAMSMPPPPPNGHNGTTSPLMSPQFNSKTLSSSRTERSNSSTSINAQRTNGRPRQVSASQASTHSTGDRSYNEQHDFYSEDVSSDSEDELDLNEDDIPVTGFAVASSKRNADFHEMFPSVPDGDYLIEDYGCALQREILIQGRFYVSENHICFHANIFGWITDLTIPICEITSLEKKMTAYVIPNAIQISTRHAKYTFASFLSRDTVYDIIHNIWRLVQPDAESIASGGQSGRPSLDDSLRLTIGGEDEARELDSSDVSNKKTKRKVTQCLCGRKGEHYSETAMEVVLPGTPEKIYNLMFASGFMKDFMRQDQKLIDIQISDWYREGNSGLLSRNFSYIKPLSGSLGPKQAKCELKDETAHCDFDDYVVTITTTRTPDVPSGQVFSVKTRTCIMWASIASTKVIVTSQVEWTGRSFIKSIIEKSAIDGQKTYHADLERAMRSYIAEHRTEFIPEGVDVAVVDGVVVEDDSSQPPSRANSPTGPSEEDLNKRREYERNQRGLQWAWDTLMGTWKVAKQSTVGALELIGDAWEQSSTTTILYFVITILVLSNLYTFILVGRREEIGRVKEMRKAAEREKWVQGVVAGLWEEMAVGKGLPPNMNRATVPSTTEIGASWRDEVGEINGALDAVEERIGRMRKMIGDLD